ncbi:hypothetical protein FN846DRAFT_966144 [Sphaerosporella brunnea]|uniref:F-box domain-containing protein n=1 Tax=Sphaerosporella brunnea TaxID=1250544 RepID=A0A5J5ELQ1_9PEZI|nr:hypothetical protein FN846DRAFT_966144 [Sphaerosporella brunnea]
MATLQTLPIELIEQIFGYLPRRDLGAVFRTCWLFHRTVTPRLFERIVIRLHDSSTLEQLRAFLDPEYFARALRYTKELHIVAEEFPLWERSQAAYGKLLIPVILAMQQCETVRITIGDGYEITREPSLFENSIRDAILALPVVKNMEYHCKACMWPPAIIKNTVTGLKSYTVRLEPGPRGFHPDYFLGPRPAVRLMLGMRDLIDAAIGGRPDLEYLEIHTGETIFFPSLGDAFRGEQVRAGPPLNLVSLIVTGVRIDQLAITWALPHLRNLQVFDFKPTVFSFTLNSGSTDILWRAFSAASIKLRVLCTPRSVTRTLLSYVRSYTGLEEFCTSRGPATPRDLGLTEVLTVVSLHSDTLRSLDLAYKGWRLDCDGVRQLRQCSQLVRLKLASSIQGLLDILGKVSTLPMLRTLDIKPFGSTSNGGRTDQIGVQFARNATMQKMIEEFELDPNSALKVIKFCGVVCRGEQEEDED